MGKHYEKKLNKKSKQKSDKKSINILYKLILLILILVLIFSVYKIAIWLIDNKKTANQLKFIKDQTTISEVSDNENTELITPKEDLPKSNPYWDYIKMNLIDVDFKNLKQINKYTTGWIQVLGTNINYPFVKGYNNEHFLYHDFENKENTAGWIFMDYRNNAESFDKNTILYGHSRKDTTMFGSLKNILTNGWYDDKNNHIIKLSTEYENTLWQVFSVYHIPETSDYLTTTFNNNDEYQSFLNLIKDRTMLKFDTTVTAEDKILTLSTCYTTNNDKRLVLHAKLIKKEQNK